MERVHDLKGRSDAQLRRIVERHEAAEETEKPLHRAALDELERRSHLRFEVSRLAIEDAARSRRFISYGDLAAASGVEWSKARLLIGLHLGDLCSWGVARGLPMLSAIVVNKEHLADGDMEEETLKGFIAAATRLGRYKGGDKRAFLKAEQDALFTLYGRPEG